MNKPCTVVNLGGDSVFPLPAAGTLAGLLVSNWDAAAQTMSLFIGATAQVPTPVISGTAPQSGSKFATVVPPNNIIFIPLDDPVEEGTMVSASIPASTGMSLYIRPR